MELGSIEMELESNFTVNELEPSIESSNFSLLDNATDLYMNQHSLNGSFVWDHPATHAVFTTLYSLVFFSCFFGNLTVILVVTLHWRMRSITNFCLANLAVADLCVAVFCVYQNLYLFRSDSWIFGTFMCKMYFYMNEMSHTASILILVVICVERYLAIIHPMRCKEWLTLTRLRITIVGVWGTSAIYCIPRLYFSEVRESGLLTEDGEPELVCQHNLNKYNYRLFDALHMTLLFLSPLIIITILYTMIGIVLWKSSQSGMPAASASESSSSSQGEGGPGSRKHTRPSCKDIFCCKSHCCKKVRFSLNPRTNLEMIERAYHMRSGGRAANHAPEEEPGQIAINTNDPIVVVRFAEKRNSFHRGSSRSRSQCTILMNASNLTQNGNGREVSTKCILKDPQDQEEETNLICNPTHSLTPATIRPGNEFAISRSPSPQVRTPDCNGNGQQPQRLRRMRVIRGGKYGTRALEARRKIIKMLVVIVVVFALCNLPYHARKLWQIFRTPTPGGPDPVSYILTPVSFLIMYANSAINPLLYAFLSQKFRLCVADFLGCRVRRTLRTTRNASVRSTHIIPVSIAP